MIPREFIGPRANGTLGAQTVMAIRWYIGLGIVAVMVGCTADPQVTPSSPNHAQENCFQISGDRVHGLGWAPDSSTLIVIHGNGRAIDELDPASGKVTRLVAETLADGPLAVGLDRGPFWIATSEDLTGANLVRLDPASRTTSEWRLPHPRFSRLFWTITASGHPNTRCPSRATRRRPKLCVSWR